MSPSDADLLARAAHGEQSAWNALVDRHGQFVYANARAAGADRTLAEDVAQLVWMRLLDNLSALRDPDRLRGWLAIVARNAARSELRRQRPTVDLDDIAAGVAGLDPSPAEVVERREDQERVRAAMARLGDACRELLTMLFSAEMSYAEISEATGRPIGSLGPTRQRCLATLRSFLADVTDTTYEDPPTRRLRSGGHDEH